MSLEEQVVELEMRLAFQDDTIAALNDVIVQLQLQMERMQQQIKVLHQRQEESRSFAITPAGQEPPPPHY
ncbi:SlyX family protein [Pseudomonas sp. F1_0610]|uniref:SlyX family protein n=1 Tax=Pseudomonas sp. F1_0610 TaxID=3114284 RepID=UPI0039C49857